MRLLLFLFILFFSYASEAQMTPSPVAVGAPVSWDSGGGKSKVKGCTRIDNLVQECNDEGGVDVSFNIFNGTQYFVDYYRVYLNDGTIIANVTNANLSPSSTDDFLVTYTVPDDIGSFCFNIKLYNQREEVCCYMRRCINIEECPDCGSISDFTFECNDNIDGGYDLCFSINNPSNASNTITHFTIFSSLPDACINGNPLPYPVNLAQPVLPGTSVDVCVLLESCNIPFEIGTEVFFTIFLEDFNDGDFCCHLDSPVLGVPNCCDNLSATVKASNADCGVNNGRITVVNITGGTPPYAVTINGVTQTTSGSNLPFDNLSPGIYSYVITDALGCELTGTRIIEDGCCNNIREVINGGSGDTQLSYTSNGEGFLCIIFDSDELPDQIQVFINGSLVVDSGMISTDFTQGQATANYPNCPGGVTGYDGVSFTPNFPVPINDGDVINVVITVGDGVCGNSASSGWHLSLSCQPTDCGGYGPARYANSSSEPTNVPRQSFNNSSMEIYPNPTKDILFIKSGNPMSYNLYNSNGQLVLELNGATDSINKIDVSHLPNGTYYVKMIDIENGNSETSKFIKMD